MPSSLERNRQRRAERLARGDCVYCGRAAGLGNKRCSVCVVRQRAAWRRRYYAAKARGLCPVCKRVATGGGLCDGCRAHETRRRIDTAAAGYCDRCQARPRDSGRFCSRCRPLVNEDQRARRERYRSEGRCACGRPIDQEGYQTCSACRAAVRRRKQRLDRPDTARSAAGEV